MVQKHNGYLNELNESYICPFRYEYSLVFNEWFVNDVVTIGLTY